MVVGSWIGAGGWMQITINNSDVLPNVSSVIAPFPGAGVRKNFLLFLWNQISPRIDTIRHTPRLIPTMVQLVPLGTRAHDR